LAADFLFVANASSLSVCASQSGWHGLVSNRRLGRLRESDDLVAALVEKSLAGGLTCCLQYPLEAAKCQFEPRNFVRRLVRVEASSSERRPTASMKRARSAAFASDHASEFNFGFGATFLRRPGVDRPLPMRAVFML
jgi:hypothetical protein